MQDILLINSELTNGKLYLKETSLEEFRNHVDSGKIGIVKSVFLEKELIQFREALLQWSEEEPENNPEIEDPDLYKKNYHRRDINPPKAKAKRFFYEFNLNNINILPSYLKNPATEIFSLMLDFQNKLAGTDGVLVENEQDNVDESVLMAHPQIMQYPSGGGFFQKHNHPYLPQRFGLILNITARGKDFCEGGTRFWTEEGRLLQVEELQSIGDLTVFRYNLLHDVNYVDPHKDIKLKDISGRWVAILPFYSQDVFNAFKRNQNQE